MKRLFCLTMKNSDKKKPLKGKKGTPMFFETKAEAKAMRNTIEGSQVSLGPDHFRFNH